MRFICGIMVYTLCYNSKYLILQDVQERAKRITDFVSIGEVSDFD